MKTLEILKTRKDELIEKTIEIMGDALSGDPANRTFFFKIDEKTDELTVDYIYYAGETILDDNCFFTIKDYETPDPEDFGYDTLEEMDFNASGFSMQIEYAINEHILNLESIIE